MQVGNSGRRRRAGAEHPAHFDRRDLPRECRTGTELGIEAKKYMDKGEYVPDSVTNAMVADRLAQPDTENGFLLDGYPRTLEQVGELDVILANLDTPSTKLLRSLPTPRKSSPGC